MKIGIIVHSHTGNTAKVAQQLEKALAAAGNAVTMERVEAESKETNVQGTVKLISISDPIPYDALVFAAPVWAFSLNPVMKTYLAQLPAMQVKRAVCFVTHHFARPWMGGNRAVRQLKEALEAKGIQVLKTGVINWSGRDLDTQIDHNVTELSGALADEKR